MQVNNEFTKLSASNLNFFYGSKQVLKNISLSFNKKEITALIGPSGCGKSTFLRTLNRMNDLIEGARLEGSIKFGDEEINHPHCDVVFQRPTPFAKSIFENVVYGLKVSGVTNKSLLMEKAEESLRRAALWDEVKDRLKDSALSLSGGQQQRLCIARALAVEPEVLLMDEPASALDPIATEKLEHGMEELKKDLCIIIVTHNMQQAMRISDNTAFFYMGELVEHGPTKKIFSNATEEKTRQYVSGSFG